MKNNYRIFITLLGILILIPALTGGLPGTGGDPGSITHNGGIVLNISTPADGEIFWIDVVPPHIMVIGSVNVSREIQSIQVKSDGSVTDCGNLTEFSCGIPVPSGNSTIAVMVVDVSGNSSSETRNISVHIGLPPPATISLSGKISDQQGLPLANVSVSSESDLTLDNKPFEVHTQTGSDGTYLIKGALGYRQKISVDKEGYVPLTQEIVFENEMNERNFELGPRSNFAPGFGIPLCLTALLSGIVVLYLRRRTDEGP
jgi:hypothetical protein